MINKIAAALGNLNQNLKERNQRQLISFEEFLGILSDKPEVVIRNVFQVFHDMIKFFVGPGIQEYPDDPESINYVFYDCRKLFVEGTDQAFMADRLFANRLINHFEALRRGAQQNKIYIFEGPPGCGKSTFLNNMLLKFEEYANTDQGCRWEMVWRLDRKTLGGFQDSDALPVLQRFFHSLEESSLIREDATRSAEFACVTEECVEVPCPSHDNPILIIPKAFRRVFLDDLFQNNEFKWKLFTEKEYEWVFRSQPCTVCSSLYQALLDRVQSPLEVLRMIFARKFQFNRRLGEGINVFNPGDKVIHRPFLSNPQIQNRINSLLKDSNATRYVYSRYARTNNGIYALMDVKSHNTERLIELHNIISEGVHKVEDIEENVNSLFIAVMNPEDKTNIAGIQSFSDRIEYLKIAYILDLNTEVEIYRNIFGRHIDDYFLPRVLHNFARVIISSRMNKKSEGLLEWIGDPRKYRLYCDESLLLLKMEVYTGYIPPWLSEEDRKRFTAKRRRRIIAESETEGVMGFSGRDSIKIFNEFFSSFAREDQLITMSNLFNFFSKIRKDLSHSIPDGFLDSLTRMYDYTVLQEVKESLYYFNETQISRDIQNYLFAINFEPGATVQSSFTTERLEINDAFFKGIEDRLLGTDVSDRIRETFRRETQKEYATRTLTQQIRLEKMPITSTDLYLTLFERYTHNLKERVLDPFLDNENFRRAIKDFDTEGFKTFDKRIRDDVTFLIKNLVGRHRYTLKGARDMCIYVIDNDLARKFPKT